MSNTTDLTNLVENEVFEDNEPAFPPAPGSLERPAKFASPVPSQPPQPPLPTAEGTPLRDNRLKLANRTEGLRTIILAFGVLSFGLTVALVIELFIGGPAVPPHGGVSSSSELCSNIGVDQLKKGGSAVDAAISVLLCIGVVRPQSSGLGGGGFMIVHDHKAHNSTLLDFREEAPKAFPVSDQRALETAGLSVGIPGELAGMYKAHSLFGRLPWTDLFTPAIKLADSGWDIDEKDVRDLRRIAYDPKLHNDEYTLFRHTISDVSGQRIQRKDLAKLLKKLSTSGAEAMKAFYNGQVANEIIETVQKGGGVMTLDDLGTYAVRYPDPLVAQFRNFRLITFPSPSSGSLLIHMLNELDSVKTKEEFGTVDYYTKLAEVTAMAYKCRSLLGDENTAAEYEDLLTNKTFNVARYCEGLAPAMPPDDHGTSHVNVIDDDEMIVSVTSSLNYWFGSMLMTPSGILLNNQLEDFEPNSKRNQPRAGTRPLSSMVPTILFHESRGCLLRMAIGGTNGTRIPTSVVQTLMSIVVKGDDLRTAVETPKIFCNDKACKLENFTGAQGLAESLRKNIDLPVSIVDEKISSVGVVLKTNSTVDGYIESSSFGKAVFY